MKIIIKTADDIKKIKQAVAIWKKVRKAIRETIHVGMTLNELDLLCKSVIEENGGIPTFKGQYGFPKHVCISVNNCVIHGVPNDYKIKDQDMVTFDVGVTYADHICDAAFTIIVGTNPEAEQISRVCRESIRTVMKILKPGISNQEIGRCIQTYVESHGYEVLRDFSGHGCGVFLHEDPMIPNYSDPFIPAVKMKENMVICIEPMILTKSKEYFIDPINQWNVYSKNGLLTCHWEDMFLITQDGYELLTDED